MKEYIVAVEDDVLAYEEYCVGYIRRQKKLIRCKDCKHVGTDATLLRVCNREGMGLRPFHVYSDDYCSYAEPKETEE